MCEGMRMRKRDGMRRGGGDEREGWDEEREG